MTDNKPTPAPKTTDAPKAPAKPAVNAPPKPAPVATSAPTKPTPPTAKLDAPKESAPKTVPFKNFVEQTREVPPDTTIAEYAAADEKPLPPPVALIEAESLRLDKALVKFCLDRGCHVTASTDAKVDNGTERQRVMQLKAILTCVCGQRAFVTLGLNEPAPERWTAETAR